MNTIQATQSAAQFQHNNLSLKIKNLLKTVETVTKNLKLQSVAKNSQKRKLVISTNWLNLFLFSEGASVTETVIGPKQGLAIKLASIGDEETKKKVYARNYKNRDRETQIDIRHQRKIDEAFGDAKEVHITFSKGNLKIIPIFEHKHNIVHEGLDINLKNDDGLYFGIIEALDVIRNKAFSSITVDVDKDFSEAHENTLFCMQLRRMGYQISTNNNGQLSAKLTNIIPAHKNTLKTKSRSESGVNSNTDVTINKETPLSTFVACTAGVDIESIESEGFVTHSILETRPVEKRDIKKVKCKLTGKTYEIHSDKTETGAINAGINAKCPVSIFNEDIYKFKISRVASAIGKNNFLHLSLQCSDFSGLKNKEDRARAVEELTSTRDMIFPALSIISATRAPTLLIENVKNFSSSIECKLFEAQLEKLGYTITKSVLKGVDFNGYTQRERCYIFATLLNTKPEANFSFPKPVKRTAHLWNDIIAPNLHMLRDVSHTKTVAKAITSGRLRVINVGDEYSPTITKSQSRQVKDSVYILMNGHYFMPSNDMIKMMMGIEKYDTSLLSAEMSTECLGQSIEGKMHRKISESIKTHILAYCD